MTIVGGGISRFRLNLSGIHFARETRKVNVLKKSMDILNCPVCALFGRFFLHDPVQTTSCYFGLFTVMRTSPTVKTGQK